MNPVAPISPEQQEIYSRYLRAMYYGMTQSNSALLGVRHGSPAYEWLQQNSILDLEAAARGMNNVNPWYTRPAPRASADWTCTYCGGKRPSETFRCEGCGASR